MSDIKIISVDNLKYNLKDTTARSGLEDKADKTEIPTKVSQLTNDSGYITSYTETDPVWNAEKGNYALKSEIPSETVEMVFTLEDGTTQTYNVLIK